MPQTLNSSLLSLYSKSSPTGLHMKTSWGAFNKYRCSVPKRFWFSQSLVLVKSPLGNSYGYSGLRTTGLHSFLAHDCHYWTQECSCSLFFCLFWSLFSQAPSDNSFHKSHPKLPFQDSFQLKIMRFFTGSGEQWEAMDKGKYCIIIYYWKYIWCTQCAEIKDPEVAPPGFRLLWAQLVTGFYIPLFNCLWSWKTDAMLELS